MSPCEREIVRAAIKWWRMHKPVVFSPREHLANPTINTCTSSEKRLAKACAALVKERRKPGTERPEGK